MRRSFLAVSMFLALFCKYGSGQDIEFRKITTDNGLSHNTVYNIVQDESGYIWFGTREGLNRYDSYNVKNYAITGSKNSSSANRISCLIDFGKNVIVGTDNGLYIYDPGLDRVVPYPGVTQHFLISCLSKTDSTVYFGTPDGLYELGRDRPVRLLFRTKGISAVAVTSSSDLLISSGNHLSLISRNGRLIKNITQEHISGPTGGDLLITNIFHEKNTDWLCTNLGLFRYDELPGNVSLVQFTPGEGSESKTVRAITSNKVHQLLIGTENGLYVYDPASRRSVNYQQSFDSNPNKLNDKAIYSAYTARDGSVWLGTYFGGVNYIPSVSSGFKSILASDDGRTLNGKAVSQLMEDSDQNIWIGTEDGGISIYNPQDLSFTNINAHSQPFHLDINNVHAIYNDGAGSIWIGTFLGGLHRFDQKTRKTTIYTKKAGNHKSLSNDNVYAVYRDSRGTLWIGTQNGLNIFDYKTNQFTTFRPEVFGREFIYDIIEDKNGDLWFCTRRDGIMRLRYKTNVIQHYSAGQGLNSVPSNQIVSVYKDSYNRLWFGTLDGGACQYDEATDGFLVLDTANGLPNNNVYGILEDGQHDLWFSTNHGLSCYNRSTKQFTNYDNRYGLPSSQFNFKSFLKSKNGTLYFGSIHGLCYFNPTTIKLNKQQVPIHFTEFQLFNEVVSPQAKTLLPRQIDDVGSIELAYAQNVFSIGYAALNFSNIKGNTYAYYLEGFETKWNLVNDKNLVTYTNLSPGNYIFHLKALDVSGIPVSKERLLRIHVSPPLYRSTLAFVLYFVLFCGAVWLYAWFVRFLNHKKLELQLERIEKDKTSALTQHRLNFFTFISHEFKTPLTLIIASVEKFMQNNVIASKKDPELSIIKTNAARLFKMIQQLMEFRTIETDHSAIKLSRHDLVKFIKETSGSFATVAQAKGLEILQTAELAVYNCYFDADKVEKIVFNILSNAVKNTAQGSISVDISFEAISGEEAMAQISITDTGRGMSKKELDNVFHTFYKDLNSEEGSGVGMALVNSLITYLNGRIAIESEVDKGTRVLIWLPVSRQIEHNGPVSSDERSEEINESKDFLPAPAAKTQESDFSHSLLIVEDNRELLVFLSKHLGKYYNVHSASNGVAALNKIGKHLPDLVISDIKMPKMDGIELCRKLKGDLKYSHIPVILLSDNARENIKIDGFDVGADAYLAKPFNLKELELLITNMISSRMKLREQLLDMSKFGLDKLPRNNKDQEFLANLGIILEKNYANPQFTVEQMARGLHISRTLLHINLKKMMDKSASQLLNDYRLKKAVLMLEKGLPINEVAYYCGYSDPNYFSRIFKKTFQVNPGAYREQAANNHPVV